MSGFDVVQVVALGFGTGLGSSLGVELAKAVSSKLKEKREKNGNI